MPIEITSTVGRLVGGHPMRRNPVTDKNGAPVMSAAGPPATDMYIGLAIPKGQEPDWKQTVWGQQIYQEAVNSWPNGEYGSPTFAWKITDGDSPIPNKKGRKPCEREGYPGHWILNLSTRMTVKCYHVGKYDPTQQIQNENEIKPGDYCRVVFTAKGNNPSESPGVYLNPQLFELSRAGQEIILDSGPSAADAFGSSAPEVPANAQIEPGIASTPTPQPQINQNTTPQPAPDFLQPINQAQPVKYVLNGVQHTEEQLLAMGLTPEIIATFPKV